MTRDPSRPDVDERGVDVNADTPLPDVPDAGADSQPISPPEPVDISTGALNTHAALTAGTFGEGEDRTLYEQALDAYEESDAADPTAVPQDFAPGQPAEAGRDRPESSSTPE